MKSILQRILTLTLTLTLCLALLASCSANPTVNEVDATEATISEGTTPSNGTMDTPTTNLSSLPRDRYYYEEAMIAQLDGTGRFYRLLAFDESSELIYLELTYSDTYIASDLKGDIELSYSVGKTDGQRIGGELVFFSQEDQTAIQEMAWGDDGKVYALFATRGKTEYFIRIYDEEMNILMDDIPLGLEPRSFFQGMAVHNGMIYVCTGYKIWKIEMDGTLIDIQDINDKFQMVMTFSIDKNTGMMYCYGQPNPAGMGKLLSYDLNQEKVVTVTKDFGIYEQMAKISIVPGGFYFSTFSSISYYDQNCELIREELVYGVDTSVKPQWSFDGGGVNVDQAGNIYIATMDNKKKSYIYKYTPILGQNTNSAVDNDRIQLSVTAHYPQPFLVDVMMRYNSSSETSALSIDAPYQTRQEWLDNRETSITKMITKIMTNDVGDIVATGGMGLSIYNLFQSDAFVDLSDYIKNSPYYDSLNKNYLDAITMDGKIYGLPVGIAIIYTVYNQSLAEELGLAIDTEKITWSNLLELARQVERMALDDVYLFRNESGNGKDVEVALKNMLLVNVDDLLDLENKTADFNQDWFVKLLTDFKEISSYDCFMAPEGIDRSASNYLFSEVEARSFGSVENFSGLEPEPFFLPPISGEINRNNLAYSYIMYSISSRSQNKDEAWLFLESMLDESIAGLNSFDAVPLDTKIAEEQIAQVSFTNFPEQAKKISDVDTMYNYINENYDDIVPVFMKYINDEITLEEAIEQAEYNVWLRLNE